MRNYGLPWIYIVNGNSMEPSLRNGDILMVKRLSVGNAGIRRRDLVVTYDPGDVGRYYVKRIVGLPGESVSLQDGLLSINGQHYTEPYLNGLPAYLGTASHVWQLDCSEFFLMGDNRAHSTDSRDHGPVADVAIIGRVTHRLWPPGRWHAFRAKSV